MFHHRSLLERFFQGFVLPVLEYCSAVWCSAAEVCQEQGKCFFIVLSCYIIIIIVPANNNTPTFNDNNNNTPS